VTSAADHPPQTGSHRVALVTGAAQGMGRDCAVRFAAAGLCVVVADVATDRGEAVAESIRDGGAQAAFVRADVTREADVVAMVAFAVQRFGRLDHAVNNAGGGLHKAPICETTEQQYDDIVDLNLKGVFLCLKHELRHFQAAGAGSIVNIASAAAYRGSVSGPIYTAAKHGVAGLTKAAAIEVAQSGVRVNAVCPGVTLTEGVVQRQGTAGMAGAEELVRTRMPNGRFLNGSEIAASALWLCSDAASGLTGSVIAVDGGMCAV
jgi:NAD(P)-dependent dehydrogenase (short-subunit alcohol dehydrogenase family)